MNIGIVGATGMVGEVFLQLLEERRFPVHQLRLFASDRSAGESRKFRGEDIPVQVLTPGCFQDLQLVFFSSGDDISRQWAPLAVEAGAYAVDNSAAFRLHPEVALVVPEVNGFLLTQMRQPAIIANPNCSTIQLVVALQPLAEKFGLSEVRVASYQSVSGAGKPGTAELSQQAQKYWDAREPKPEVFPHPIGFNCIPQIGSIGADGFCTEETKIMRETRKIMSLPNLKISAFTVRVPTFNSHSEAVWATLQKQVEPGDIQSALESAPGLRLESDWARYPTQRASSGTDPVYVGRVHRDLDDPRTWLMWIVSDNLRKGAALNGLQIAERLFDIH